MSINVKEIVRYFKQSVKAADMIRLNTDLKLIQSVPTWLNSTLYMMQRFLELANLIGNTLMEFLKSPIMVTAIDLLILKELCTILESLEQATKDISSDKYVTLT